jgi:hypothetical protein
MAKAEMSKVETWCVRRVPPARPTSFLHGVYVASTARRPLHSSTKARPVKAGRGKELYEKLTIAITCWESHI